ncbi:O-antigen polymerase [Vibrio vulnificus]|uniref:O-antigen polymerase n=1 Tax=Vibrio vulnificus TaxID=672 RepID=UPI0012AD9634|nr:O-antigen polymerase [Vibrio vulnificus]EJD0676811.1 oligosaccharide repeat unit polymerase [Vibrio vulnificus]EJZ7971013.1 oligosaccharide repeat unit polymerase [Vibrio vulnificus]HAS8286378.1 oligosaccharide repeat unit polymerase [Vibrio vulnificus]
MSRIKRLILLPIPIIWILFFLVGSINLEFYLILIFLILSWLYFCFDYTNPYVLISPFAFIYNVSYYLVGDDYSIYYESYHSELFQLLFLYLNGFFFFTLILYKKKKEIVFVNKSYDNEMKYISLIICILSWCLMAYYSIGFVLSGVQTKSQLVSLGFNSSISVYISKLGLLSYLLFLYVSRANHKKIPNYLIYIPILAALLYTLALGERSVLLSYVLIILIYHYSIKAVSGVKLSVLSFIVISFIPILNGLKNVFTKNEIVFNEGGFVTKLLSGEFISSSKNVMFLLRDGFSDYFYGETLVWDFMRVFSLQGFGENMNAISWYNKTYHSAYVDLGMGYGFSFLGEGFINFGYFGAVLWGGILGGISTVLYNGIFIKRYMYITYIFIVPVLIYAQRGDFSSILSPIVKQVIIPVLIIHIVSVLIYKVTKGEKITYNM